jgi:membrane-bound lytic murein transglycosylase B
MLSTLVRARAAAQAGPLPAFSSAPASRPARALTLMLTLALGLAVSAVPAAARKSSSTSTKRAPARVVAAEHAPGPSYAERDDALAYAQEIAQRHGLDPTWVRHGLAQARQLPAVQRLVMPAPAGVAKNWAAYRARFVEPKRIQAGLDFWREHEAALAQAERVYGVPPSLVLGVLGVETYFGRLTGQFRVLDALATLSFDFPSGRRDRSGFFRDELAALFLLAQREGLDPLELKGSFAGAMGLPQFMPSSWTRWAVDFDGDGRADLLRSPADVVGSVAHYMASFGWKPGLPTHFGVRPPSDGLARAALLAPDILPSFSAEQMGAQGALLDRDGQGHDGPLALVELQNGDAASPSYIAATTNFYVVTRYNWSAYYALAVLELGEAIEKARSRALSQAR